jgi:hypothetical protein
MGDRGAAEDARPADAAVFAPAGAPARPVPLAREAA